MPLPSEVVARKVENVSTELYASIAIDGFYLAKITFAMAKMRLSSEKHHNRAKKSLAKAKIYLLSGIFGRKTRFRICGRRFLSIKSFSHLRVTPLLGKSVFGFSSDVFARKNTFSFGKCVLAPSTRFRVCLFAR